MEAKELRMGNYVSQDGEEIHGLVGLTIHKFELNQIKLEPIPLTEDILLMCGFEQDVHNQFFYDKGQFSIKRNIYSDKETDYSLCGNVSCINFKYIHQLQNLYFALTGEELNKQD